MTTWNLLVPNAQTGAFHYNETVAYDSILSYDSPINIGYTVFWKLQNAN